MEAKAHRFSSASKPVKLFLLLLIAGFSVGISTHCIDLIRGGFLPYHHVPLWKNIFWTSLTVLDIAVVLLLFFRVYIGLILANLVIVSDVLINTEFFSFFAYYRIWMQTAFAVLVIVLSLLIIYRIKAERASLNKIMS